MERRPCSACGAHRPTGAFYGYCNPCNREVAAARRRRPGRPCPGCREPLKPGQDRCRDCWRKYNEVRFNRWSRRCPGGCGDFVGHGYRRVYCPMCSSLNYREAKLEGRR